MVLSSDDIKQSKYRKSATGIRLFFHRWSLLLVLLYGFFGFLFYLFLLLTNHGIVTTGLPFRDLSKEALWFSLLVFTGLHFTVFIGGVFMLLYNKVLGFVLAVAALLSILLANTVINGEINYTSWGILLILIFFLSKCRHPLN